MFQQPFRPQAQRTLKTSEPRFKRLSRVVSPQSRMTTQQNFNPGGKAYALDNSKQNLLYEHHLTKVRSACKFDETAIVSKYLSSIRKDYDDMNKLSRKELNSMKLKRRQIQFIKHKNQIFCDKRKQLEVEIEVQQKNTDEIRLKEEDAKMQTKTLENIIVRMKKDQIYYKLQGRIRDEELKRRIKEVKLLDETFIHEQEKLYKLCSNLQDCKDLCSKNQVIRQKKFEDFSGKISDVRERDRFIHERKERTYELQSIELNDTLDEKNIHMREIMLAHKVADSMLEGKVNTLIKKYSDIQGAFHLVKIKTGVSEPQFLTSKFFSYEQTSESLLQTISDNEKQLQELKKKKQQLTQKYKTLSNQHLIEDQFCLSKDATQATWKEKITNEVNQNHLLVDSITTWINRMLLDVRQTECPKNTTLQDKFSMLCSNLQANLNKYQNFDWNNHRPTTIGVCLKKMVRQKSPEELSVRLRETLDLNQSNIVEEEYIKSSRKNIQKKAFTIKQIKRDHHD